MTDHHPRKDLEQVRNYVAEVATLLRMQNWDIYIDADPYAGEDPDGTAWAATEQDRNHWTGIIRFSRDFFTEATPAMKRHIVVHELIHFQHRDALEVWRDCILRNDAIAEADANAYNGDFMMHLERFVSWVTCRLEHVAPVWPGAQTKPATGVFIGDEWTAG